LVCDHDQINISASIVRRLLTKWRFKKGGLARMIAEAKILMG
jgi:hypothetical protein